MVDDEAYERAAREWCGHFSLDINGNCMRCAHDKRDREAKAKAWDEGWEAAWSPMSMHSLNDGPNPYRTSEATDAD